jgi:IS30 family transposase
MAGKCKICTSWQRELIERAITRGTPYRKIALRYGLSKSAISRHIKNHLPWGKALIRFKAQTMSEYHGFDGNQELNCKTPGTYLVSKEKASQLLRDFPLDFEEVA